MSTTPRLVSCKTAADRLEVNPVTIRRWISQGRLTGYRLGPRLVKVSLDELDQMARRIPTADRQTA